MIGVVILLLIFSQHAGEIILTEEMVFGRRDHPLCSELHV